MLSQILRLPMRDGLPEIIINSIKSLGIGHFYLRQQQAFSVNIGIDALTHEINNE